MPSRGPGRVMKVAVFFTPAPPDAPPEDLDGLVQAESVEEALRALGHETVRVPCRLNLEATASELEAAAPDCVFNLVEAVAGQDRLLLLAPALLDALSLPYTGAGLDASLLTTNKLLAKQWLTSAGLPTPPWCTRDGRMPLPLLPEDMVIIKSAWEHGSAGLEASALRPAGELRDLQRVLRRRSDAPGRELFAERFIAGREFNISLLAAPQGPEALPPAEIRFSGFGADKPKIVGYRAKWETDSFEYQNTSRSFDFPGADAPLLTRLKDLARRCWHVFALRGFVRVDFRVDESGQPWILEININPCISPDAGFAAAAARHGLSYVEAVGRILDDAAAKGVDEGDGPIR